MFTPQENVDLWRVHFAGICITFFPILLMKMSNLSAVLILCEAKKNSVGPQGTAIILPMLIRREDLTKLDNDQPMFKSFSF